MTQSEKMWVVALTNMIDLYLGSEAGTQISSLIKGSEAKASLEGYAHEALSSLPLQSSHRTELILLFIQDLIRHSEVYIVCESLLGVLRFWLMLFMSGVATKDQEVEGLVIKKDDRVFLDIANANLNVSSNNHSS